MFAEELIRKCDKDYVNNASREVCKNCSHERKCPGNCGKCLDEVHLSRGTNERKDYSCIYMLDFYVGKYMYAYIEEDKRAFDIIKEGLNSLNHINMLSIGCGPSPDLFAIIEYIKENEMNKRISYIGIEHNRRWENIHNYIDEILGGEANIQYVYQDVFEIFRETTLSRTNILVMQYLLSHITYNQREEEISSFFDNLVEHVIMKMEAHSYIIINDINHNLARDKFEILEEKLKNKGKRILVHKYFFEFRDDLNVHQKLGMVRHSENRVLRYIEPTIRNRYATRMDCRSVQHIIEVNDL